MAKQKKLQSPTAGTKSANGRESVTDMFERGSLAGMFKGKPWQELFLQAFAETGIISAAAKIVGVNNATIHRERKKNPEFAKQMLQARAQAIDAIELEARRRALHGWEEPLMYQGQQVGVIRKYSDSLLMFMLKGRRPKVYGDKLKVDQKTTITTIQQGREGLYAEIAARLKKPENSN